MLLILNCCLCIFFELKFLKASAKNINVISNWVLNQTPLIPLNKESRFSYSENSNDEVHDKVLENENTDDNDIDDLFF